MGLTCMETCEHVGKRYTPCCIAAALPRHRLCCHDVQGRGSLHPLQSPQAEPCAVPLTGTHTVLLLRACFAHYFPCLVGFFFSLTAFSCLFFPLSCSHTCTKHCLFFILPLLFSPPPGFLYFYLILTLIPFPGSQAGWGCVSFQYHCFETNLLGYVMGNQMVAE